MQRVTIIGLGLVGGSIGLGLRQWAATNAPGQIEVTGFDTNVENEALARKMKAVDRTEWDLAKAVQPADLVILATPVRAMRDVMADIGPKLRSGTTVTDVGSTKQQVMEWAAELLPVTVSFVGGHPMAGRETSIEGAEATLFNGATWCLCPSVRANEEAVRTVLGLVTALGAEPYFVDPVEHDAFVAGISHLPMMLSTAMVNAIGNDPSWRDMKGLAAGGYRDMSRLAAGSIPMHRDIALTNRDAILRWLDALEAEIDRARVMLAEDEAAAVTDLNAWFESARDRRIEWQLKTSRESEQLGATGKEAMSEGFSDQMGRMLFGGLRKRPKPGSTPPGNGSGTAS